MDKKINKYTLQFTQQIYNLQYSLKNNKEYK